MDRELLGRVAALTRGQQRWFRTVLQSVLTMETPGKLGVEGEPSERPRQATKRRPAAPEPAEEPRRQGLDELLSGEGTSKEDYPELAGELEGIGDIADLLRESGRERRRFGEELKRRFEGGEGSAGEDDEDNEDEENGARFN